MALVVTIGKLGWQIGKDGGITYQEQIIGPFRDEDRAHRKRDGIERGLKRAGLDGDWEARVEYVWPAGEAIRDIVSDIENREGVQERART